MPFMNKEFWTVTEIIESFEIDEVFCKPGKGRDSVSYLYQEAQPKLFTASDMEKTV